MDRTLPKSHVLNLQPQEHPLGVPFWPVTFYDLKSSHQDFSNEGSKSFLSSLEHFFEAAQTSAFLDKLQILAGLSRTQKKQSSEFTEFSTKTRKISNWVMPSAFICIKKQFHKNNQENIGYQ